MEQYLTVREAAKALGITENNVRTRISRGSLRKDLNAKGRTIVIVDVDLERQTDSNKTDTGNVTGNVSGDESAAKVIARLENEVGFLREELHRRDQLLLAAVQRPVQLLPPSVSDSTDILPHDTGVTQPVKRSLWRRLTRQ